MGFPQLQSLITKKFVLSTQPLISLTCDYLMFDMPNVVHNVVQRNKEIIDQLNSNEEALQLIFKKAAEEVETFIQKINPSKEVFLAFDGKSPEMKLIEGFKRRFFEKKSFSKNFDKNCINRSNKVISAIKEHFKEHFKNFHCTAEQGIKYSDGNDIGEGEVKIMNWIEEKKISGKKITIISDDSDFFLLTLDEKYKDVSIVLKERFHNIASATVVSSKIIKLYFRKIILNFFQKAEIKSLIDKEDISWKKVYVDIKFIFSCCFKSDFAPGFGLSIRDDVFNVIQGYVEAVLMKKMYLVDEFSITVPAFLSFLEYIDYFIYLKRYKLDPVEKVNEFFKAIAWMLNYFVFNKCISRSYCYNILFAKFPSINSILFHVKSKEVKVVDMFKIKSFDQLTEKASYSSRIWGSFFSLPLHSVDIIPEEYKDLFKEISKEKKQSLKKLLPSSAAFAFGNVKDNHIAGIRKFWDYIKRSVVVDKRKLTKVEKSNWIDSEKFDVKKLGIICKKSKKVVEFCEKGDSYFFQNDHYIDVNEINVKIKNSDMKTIISVPNYSKRDIFKLEGKYVVMLLPYPIIVYIEVIEQNQNNKALEHIRVFKNKFGINLIFTKKEEIYITMVKLVKGISKGSDGEMIVHHTKDSFEHLLTTYKEINLLQHFKLIMNKNNQRKEKKEMIFICDRERQCFFQKYNAERVNKGFVINIRKNVVSDNNKTLMKTKRDMFWLSNVQKELSFSWNVFSFLLGKGDVIIDKNTKIRIGLDILNVKRGYFEMHYVNFDHKREVDGLKYTHYMNLQKVERGGFKVNSRMIKLLNKFISENKKLIGIISEVFVFVQKNLDREEGSFWEQIGKSFFTEYSKKYADFGVSLDNVKKDVDRKKISEFVNKVFNGMVVKEMLENTKRWVSENVVREERCNVYTQKYDNMEKIEREKEVRRWYDNELKNKSTARIFFNKWSKGKRTLIDMEKTILCLKKDFKPDFIENEDISLGDHVVIPLDVVMEGIVVSILENNVIGVVVPHKLGKKKVTVHCRESFFHKKNVFPKKLIPRNILRVNGRGGRGNRGRGRGNRGRRGRGRGNRGRGRGNRGRGRGRGRGNRGRGNRGRGNKGRKGNFRGRGRKNSKF